MRACLRRRCSRRRLARSSRSARTRIVKGGRRTVAWKLRRCRGPRRRAAGTVSNDHATGAETARGSDAQTTLDAWRERGGDRLDPLRFHFIAALARRAAAHEGEARRMLDARLSALLEAYAADLAGRAAAAQAPECAAVPCRPACGPLGELADYIASHPQAGDEDRKSTRLNSSH